MNSYHSSKFLNLKEGFPLKVFSSFNPSGDQPKAIKKLVQGVIDQKKTQVLLGVTGSGKTFTMAKVIELTQRPAIIIAPNKTLAAQLYGEFKSFFPRNAVEYFVSYYDYYQPEAYLPGSDTYIEKKSYINDQIDRMRHSTTRSLLERKDVIIVSSVSCIYGIGSSEFYTAMTLQLKIGDNINQQKFLSDLVSQKYLRQEKKFERGSFRVRGDTIEIFPIHSENIFLRICFFGNTIDTISEFDSETGKIIKNLKSVKIYANSHYIIPKKELDEAIKFIKIELKNRVNELRKNNRLIASKKLEERVKFDLEMLEATGSCSGIENYSRYLTQRQVGDPPPTIFEYISKDTLIFIDESHITIPQIVGMYRSDFHRKKILVEYGFRLPSCVDNRPLRFEEWDVIRPQTIAVSATPGKWEMQQSNGVVIEQIIRPTGLVDPPVEVRSSKTQINDIIKVIEQKTKKGHRSLITVLTKNTAEDLSEYLKEKNIKTKYLHADVDILERIKIIHDLRTGDIDVLVGINLLREGLDIPECGFVAILDADKEGFLRSETSLIQTIGRAARNVNSNVILYANKVTSAMKNAINETIRRRNKQISYNISNKITPISIKKDVINIFDNFIKNKNCGSHGSN